MGAIDHGWARRSLERYARGPLNRSALFGVLTLLLLVVIIYAVWILTSFWSVLPASARVEAVLVLVTSPLPLLLAIQQQRFVRSTASEDPRMLRITVLTFAIVAWSYACLVMALHVLRATLAAGG